MIDKEYLKESAKLFEFELDDEMLNMFDSYASLLVEWNAKVNLTAIVEPKEIVIKHFVDSLLLLKAAEIPQNGTLIDIGAGAGFPSLPCKLYRRDLNITLLDGLNKRINFLSQVVDTLGIRGVTLLHGRAEDEGKRFSMREKFDIASARAVAKLTELCEYCLPYVKEGGCFAALKGFDVDEELEAAKGAIAILGGKTEKVLKFELPDGSKRSVVVVKKISQTPTKYPRSQGKINKQPL